MSETNLQRIITNHLKTYGFVTPNSEIYNGLANAWDFGPLGAVCSVKLKNLWLNEFVFKRPNMYLIDSNIIANPTVWSASGHLENFIDWLIDCKNCKKRFRLDKLLMEVGINIDRLNVNELESLISQRQVKCPNCHQMDWTKARKFNLLFQTSKNVLEDEKIDALFLRPETAQGAFINYAYVLRTMRCSLPFGIAQIGKAFRNEITPGNFIFRTREFEQMEIEWFCKEENALSDFERFKNEILVFLFQKLKISGNKILLYEQTQEELAHYARKTIDFRFEFPHGWDELLGLSYRGDFDLNHHQKQSGVNLEYLDPETKQKYIPHVVEPSFGLNRLLYAIFTSAFCQEELPDGSLRVILKLPALIAPYQAAVLPLVKKNNAVARRIFKKIMNNGINATIDFSGSIGKKYRRQDAIGTPLCITADFDSMKKTNPTVTIRHRDSMKQVKCRIDKLVSKIQSLLKKL